MIQSTLNKEQKKIGVDKQKREILPFGGGALKLSSWKLKKQIQ